MYANSSFSKTLFICFNVKSVIKYNLTLMRRWRKLTCFLCLLLSVMGLKFRHQVKAGTKVPVITLEQEMRPNWELDVDDQRWSGPLHKAACDPAGLSEMGEVSQECSLMQSS